MARHEHTSRAALGAGEEPLRPPGSVRFALWSGALALGLVLSLQVLWAYRALEDFARENATVAQVERTRAALDAILGDVLGAETAQRAYLVTGDPALLPPYEGAVRILRRDVAALEPLVQDRPAQLVRYEDLRGLVQQRLQRLDRGIALRQDEWAWFTLGAAELDSHLRADRAAMERVRELIGAMQAAEARAMAEGQAGAARAAREARLAALVPAALSLPIVLGVFYLLGRGEAGRRRADAAWHQERERLLAEERAARREAEEANRAKDEFLSTVSHELRAPLQGMLGWVEVLKRPQSSEPQRRQAVERMEHGARSQARIVDDLLDAARMVSGKVKLRLAQVDLDGLVSDAADICRPAAQARGIDFRLCVAERGLRLAGDRDRLQQIVVNLLSNAIKFTPQGGAVVLSLRRDGAQIEIEVKDTGIGIAPHMLERIFDRYVQASTSSTRRHGGLGLGLSIVRHLAELHGGSVSAASEGEGRGASFVLRLPVSPAAAGAAELPGQRHEAGPIAGLRVLVVDDEEDTRELLSMLLAAEGAQVEAAGSARQALARLGERRFDVLVSDIGMPDEDGYSLLRRVRDARPEASATPPAVPAIALSAYAQFQDRRRALECGFDTQLAKPVEIADLVAAIAGVAGRVAANK